MLIIALLTVMTSMFPTAFQIPADANMITYLQRNNGRTKRFLALSSCTQQDSANCAIDANAICLSIPSPREFTYICAVMDGDDVTTVDWEGLKVGSVWRHFITVTCIIRISKCNIEFYALHTVEDTQAHQFRPVISNLPPQPQQHI
jgi:hypothetical protein